VRTYISHKARDGWVVKWGSSQKPVVSRSFRTKREAEQAAKLPPPRPARIPVWLLDVLVAARDRGHSYPELAGMMMALKIPAARGGSTWHPATVRTAILRRRCELRDRADALRSRRDIEALYAEHRHDPPPPLTMQHVLDVWDEDEPA
jgi:hypothetical protein